MKPFFVIASAIALTATTPALADHHRSSTIVETAIASPQHETLVAAVKAAGLVDTLAGQGPFTVFAPTDSAFAKLPEDTVATLLKPENVTTLRSVLTYHVVAGKVSASELIGMIDENGGSAQLKTVQGALLTASLSDGKVILTDSEGGTASVVQADLKASNGIIHATDTVSMPG
ncbi:fasciclin domain-containing protein [Novosphingobium malaysiense]|uniref:Fasciclin n=1 Tax=Novosphingobium malaysiense TaxID=1348853 RepID=A0A0B1ZKP9_9SPHN|nr:fasciclin domain-containing protein [Novosphingobium malaysiense]KHK91101.1 fasciclin [Novosphingobium malaysiense]